MRTQSIKSNTPVKGIVTKRLFDTKKLELAKKAAANGAPASFVRSLLDEAAKPMFAENKLWQIANKLFGIDLRIQYITGVWTLDAIKHNVVTDVGLRHIAQQVGGTTTAPTTAIALGTGTPSATALGTEITTDGGQRGGATISNQTTTTTGDTERWVKTFSFTDAFAITEEGLFNNNTSGGIMLASQTFATINVDNGDSLQITHELIISTT